MNVVAAAWTCSPGGGVAGARVKGLGQIERLLYAVGGARRGFRDPGGDLGFALRKPKGMKQE